MNIFLILLIIQLIIVFVTDLTDFPSTIYKLISSILTKGKLVSGNGKLHLISCSLCQVHWAGLLYLIITGSFSFYMWGYVCLLAFLTPVSRDALITLKDILTWILNQINKITLWKR